MKLFLNKKHWTTQTAKRFAKLLQSLAQYVMTTKLWTYPSLYALLLKDQELKENRTSVEAIFSWPGKTTNKIYVRHRELNMPFSFIPNCSRFTATLRTLDWVFALFGLSVRGGGSVIETRNWGNGRANKYLFSEFLYLGTLRDRGSMDDYWKKAWQVMHSEAYLVSCFNYVLKGWERDIGTDAVNKLCKEIKGLVEMESTEAKITRVYIPKANGKQRPLGVPTKAWRVYTNMLNNMLVWSRKGKEGTQHAYFPGRGVHTAWREVLDLASQKNIRHIIETDLKGFFDNVRLDVISKEMELLGYPERIAEWFKRLNRSLVKLPSKDLIEEPDRGVAFTADLKPNPQYKGDPLNQKLISFDLISGTPELAKNLAPDLKGLIASILGGFAKVNGVKGGSWKSKGVPQGMATSCSTSTLALSGITDPRRLARKIEAKLISWGINAEQAFKESQEVRVIMYADDAIIFGPSELACRAALDLFEEAGVETVPEKTSTIKSEGIFLKSIKFLGILWDPVDNTIRASTRGGATLEFGVKEQFLAYVLEKRGSLLSSDAIKFGGSAASLNSSTLVEGQNVRSWIMTEACNFACEQANPLKLLFSGARSGYFLSCLYNDSWVNTRPSNMDLQAHRGAAWVKVRWPIYRLQAVSDPDLRTNLLVGGLHRVLKEIEDLGNVAFNWSQLLKDGTKIGYLELKERVINLGKTIRAADELLTEVTKFSQALWFFEGDGENKPKGVSIYYKGNQNPSDTERNGPKVAYEELREIVQGKVVDHHLIMSFEMYPNLELTEGPLQSWYKKWHSRIPNLRSLTLGPPYEPEKGWLILREGSKLWYELAPFAHDDGAVKGNYEISDKAAYTAFATLGETLQLNVYNSSTFACHDLLRNNLELPIAEKDPQLPIERRIKYIDYDERVLDKTEKEHYWNLKLPERFKKLGEKIVKRFKEAFLMEPAEKLLMPEKVVEDYERSAELLPAAVKTRFKYNPERIKSPNRINTLERKYVPRQGWLYLQRTNLKKRRKSGSQAMGEG